MLTLNFTLQQIQAFMLIFLRVAAILFSVPLFDAGTIPILFKAGLAISISFLLYPILNLETIPAQIGLLTFFFAILAEIAVGVIIGLCVKILFTAIQLAGQMAGYQMGFAVVNVMDPATSSQIPLLAQFNNLFAMLIFLAVNAHHLFLKAMVESFHLVPPFGFELSRSLPGLMGPLMKMAAGIFVIAIKIGAPIMGAMLLTSVALGIIARTVPQMHVFIVAMPLKIVIGFLFMGLTLPYLTHFLKTLFTMMSRDIFVILNLLS